jgi:hypothetical protein
VAQAPADKAPLVLALVAAAEFQDRLSPGSRPSCPGACAPQGRRSALPR